MRYTTIIDIRENRQLYKNQNARLIYLHLALASGYHDNDRDIAEISLRALAEQTGITISATRHAITQLAGAGLVERRDKKFHVKKWILDPPPTPRPRKAQAANVRAAGQIGAAAEQEKKEYQQRVMAAIRASTKDELHKWLEELENGRSIKHHGVYINPNQANAEWLRQVITKV